MASAYEDALAKEAAAAGITVAEADANYHRVSDSGFTLGGTRAFDAFNAANGAAVPVVPPPFPWLLVGGGGAAVAAVYFLSKRKR